MNYNLVYFSPTYTTQKIIRLIAEEFSSEAKEFDIIAFTESKENLIFSKDDFVIFGIPVYSGRVPKIANDHISSMIGNGTSTALVATYGNRHYDDALLELSTIVKSNGFTVIAAAAFVTEHSVVPKFGLGRPDDEDIKIIRSFAKLLNDKLNKWDGKSDFNLKIKGNTEYRKYQSIPIKPHTKATCNKCGLCAKECPAGAIFPNNPKKIDKSKCVTCMRCIRICPQNARGFYPIESFIAEKSLSKLCKGYKQSEIFI